MKREEIDKKYINQANQLEADFFDIVDEGLPNQHRVLKVGRTEADFNAQHAIIWQNHEAELIASGYLEPRPEPTPPRSTHYARIDSFHIGEVKPLRVTRTWDGKEYTYDCFVTQDLVDAYQADKLEVGDHVLVYFDDQDREIATQKVFKTW